MSADSLAIIGGAVASVLLLVGTIWTTRSTDRGTTLNAAAKMREEADKKLDQAWEQRLAAKSEQIEELTAEVEHLQSELEKTTRLLAEANARVMELVQQVQMIQQRVSDVGGAPDGA